MRKPIRFLSHAFAVAALACAGAASSADAMVEVDGPPTGEQMAVDLVIVRPLSLAGTLIGVGIFVVALPFNALTLNFKEPAQALVIEPAKYTFTRKLGDLE